MIGWSCSREQGSRPYKRYSRSWYPTAFIADLDRDVLAPLDDNHLDRGERVLVVDAKALDYGSERVLEKLKEDM